ncbi:MAG: hypothetical protein IBX68_12720 [Dehalococcoidia bacterium]|nr:hypothetical protein [Dehalococcoidia bacterium]
MFRILISVLLALGLVLLLLGCEIEQVTSPAETSNAAEPEAAESAGFSRGDPADIGTVLAGEAETLEGVFDVEITLKEIIRGEQAWQEIEEANMFNDPPQSGHEYILALFHVKVLSGPDDDTQLDLHTLDFTAVSEQGKDYEWVFVVEPEPALAANLYPGSSHEGWAVFEIAEEDTQPLVTFGRDYAGRGGMWWKLFEQPAESKPPES